MGLMLKVFRKRANQDQIIGGTKKLKCKDYKKLIYKSFINNLKKNTFNEKISLQYIFWMEHFI